MHHSHTRCGLVHAGAALRATPSGRLFSFGGSIVGDPARPADAGGVNVGWSVDDNRTVRVVPDLV
jgi:hypothetical protein